MQSLSLGMMLSGAEVDAIMEAHPPEGATYCCHMHMRAYMVLCAACRQGAMAFGERRRSCNSCRPWIVWGSVD